MCYEYQERLAWIRRMEQVEKELKEAEERKKRQVAASSGCAGQAEGPANRRRAGRAGPGLKIQRPAARD